jgi:hypothetical protein
MEEKKPHTIRTDFGFNLLRSASKLKRGEAILVSDWLISKKIFSSVKRKITRLNC